MKQSNQSLKKQNPTVVAAGNLTHKSEKEISMKNCNTTVPNEQALNTVLSHKRCLAVAVIAFTATEDNTPIHLYSVYATM